MTGSEFKLRTQKLIKQMIDTIADKEYTKLIFSIPPKLSWSAWSDMEPTPENACIGFGEWLVEQLALWEDYYDKEFVIDHFNKPCMEEIDESRLEMNQRVIVTYNPTSFGEPLDFWFEIEFFVENEQITAVFDVNI